MNRYFVGTLVPLKDGNDKHLGYILGGRGAEWDDYGVKYFSGPQENHVTVMTECLQAQLEWLKAGKTSD